MADKKKEIEVWNLKNEETYTPSLVSDSFIYITHIYFELWSSKYEKKLKISVLRILNLDFSRFAEALNIILKIWKNQRKSILGILTTKKKYSFLSWKVKIDGAPVPPGGAAP